MTCTHTFITSSNETISGVQFRAAPIGKVPCHWSPTCHLTFSQDRWMSINLVSFTPVRRKNIGQAGLAVVVVRKDLLQDLPPGIPGFAVVENPASEAGFTP